MSKEPTTYYAHCVNCKFHTEHNEASGKCLVGGCGVIDPAKLDQHQVHTEDTQQDSGDPRLRADIEGVIESSTDDISTKDLIKLLDAFEVLIQAREREARIDELKRAKMQGYITGSLVHKVDRRLQQLGLNPQAGDGGEV